MTAPDATDGHAGEIQDDDAFDGAGAAAAVDRTHEWFHHNSGWAPPDDDTLADWLADGVCRAPDECLVKPRSWCDHGLASWLLVLETVDDR